MAVGRAMLTHSSGESASVVVVPKQDVSCHKLYVNIPSQYYVQFVQPTKTTNAKLN